MPPPNSCPLGTSEYNLFWKQDLCRCNEVKIRSYWTNTGVNPETDILIRRGSFAHRHTNTHIQRTPCDSGERETAREHKGLPAKKLEERHGSDSPSEPPEQPT